MSHLIHRWTPDEITILHKRVDEKRSAGQIGAELGRTRNAVISKCARSGLQLQGGSGCVPGPRAEKPRIERRAAPKRVSVVAKPVSLPEPIDAPVGPLLSIFELTDATCKFPIGTPGEEGFGFCGAPSSLEHLPYCRKCHSIAYSGTFTERDAEKLIRLCERV